MNPELKKYIDKLEDRIKSLTKKLNELDTALYNHTIIFDAHKEPITNGRIKGSKVRGKLLSPF